MIQIANLSQNFINEKLMKTINIIGIVLIFLVSTIGNRIAPGRYCTYYNNDTVWAFGSTKSAENDKCGFWVYQNKWYKGSLGIVGIYCNDKPQGIWTEFRSDTLCTVFARYNFADGLLNVYDYDGKMIRKYKMFNDTIGGVWDLSNPNASYGLNELRLASPLECGYEYVASEDKIVVFNSWTNSITTINVLIGSVLILLNAIDFIKKGDK